MSTAANLAVVIPTRERWPVLARTLAALRAQTVTGFEVNVVVDGRDEVIPDLGPVMGAVRVHVQDRGGPAPARNLGARSTDRPLILFLDDDMVATPTLVERHLAVHTAEGGAPQVAVLGHVEWHPDHADAPLNRWLDETGFQFDFASINGREASFAHFFSANVSVDREFFLGAGGFDEDFTIYYEDIECGWRLHNAGMRLVYDREALAYHYQRYDAEGLSRRWARVARGERIMTTKAHWFEPFFHERFRAADNAPPVPRRWVAVADRWPAQVPMPARLASRVRVARMQQFAPAFLDVWDGERDLDELRDYLGDRFDYEKLQRHHQLVEAEEEAALDEQAFYRTSEAYLYDLTVFAMSGTKTPYRRALRTVVRPGARLLDYGCGIGSDGLRLLENGYDVSFADFDNPSTQFLSWRLQHRGIDAPVYDVDHGVPVGFDAVYCFDVIEHIEDPFAFLAELERHADIVAVNFLEPAAGDAHMHRPLPIGDLLRHATGKGLLHYRVYHGRSHLVIYRSSPATGLSAVSDRVVGVARRAQPAVRRRVGSTTI